MKRYSRLNLLEEEMSKLEERGFSKFLFHLHGKYVYLKIYLPNKLYLRANVLIDDICELTQEEFTLADLLLLLYQDWLLEVRKHNNIPSMFTRLNVRDMKTPSLYMNNKEVTMNKEETEGYQEFRFRLMRKEVIRCEVLLQEIEDYYPGHPFTVESVLEILFIDFMNEFIKSGGNVIKEIISRIEKG